MSRNFLPAEPMEFLFCRAARKYDLMFAAMRLFMFLFFTAVGCLCMLVSDTLYNETVTVPEHINKNKNYKCDTKQTTD